MDIFIHSTFYPFFEKHLLCLIDVGASGGLKARWKKIRRFLRLYCVEPDTQEFNNLVRSRPQNTTYLNTALYKENANLTFYRTRKQQCSSLFPPNRDFLDTFPEPERFDIIETTQVSSGTLDRQLQERGCTDVDFIKIDTQGSELSILQGAEQALANAFGLEIEVEFTEIYKGQPLFSEVELFLRKRGFQLFDLKPYYWKRKKGKQYGKAKGQLIFADALFFKNERTFKILCERVQTEMERKAKILHALGLCLLYGYVDYAIELFEGQGKTFSAEERVLFQAFLKRSIPWSQKLPFVLGRNRLAKVIRTFSQLIAHHPWAKAGEELGNM